MPPDAPGERIRLRVKLGTDEFEAVGPAELVAQHFRTWRTLVAMPRGAGAAAGALPSPSVASAVPADLFAVDPQRKLVTLRHSPRGTSAHADAALLLLYGFHRSLDGDGSAIPVTRLRAALTASGHTDSRIDRTLERYRIAGLVKKRGQRKGSSYQLTASGRAHAAGLVHELATTLAAGR